MAPRIEIDKVFTDLAVAGLFSDDDGLQEDLSSSLPFI
jgi:hypothetical protein